MLIKKPPLSARKILFNKILFLTLGLLLGRTLPMGSQYFKKGSLEAQLKKQMKLKPKKKKKVKSYEITY